MVLGGDSNSEIGLALRNQLNGDSLGDVLEQLRRCPVGLETDLSKTVSFGVAFHHAGINVLIIYNNNKMKTILS